MKLLYLGMESANWVINLCNKICERGHQVDCIVQGVDEYDKDNPITPHEDLKVEYVPYSEFSNPNAFRSKHIDKIIDKKYDIVFGSHVQISPTTKMIAEMLSTPWGIMILDIPTHLMVVDRRRMKDWLYYFEIMKYADMVVFNTHIARDEYHRYTGQYFPDDCIITYGINMDEKYYKGGIDIEGDYVLSVCRLVDAKNCQLIAQALGFLGNIKKYVCVGRDEENGKQLKLLNKLCDTYGIEFVHYDNVSEEQKFELIRDCNMLIYPQKTEYIGGLSPWESLYQGKPTLVPKLKVMNDLYKDNVNYFENDNVISLAREIAMTHALNPKVTRDLRDKGAEYAKKEASFENMAEKLEHTFEVMGFIGKK